MPTYIVPNKKILLGWSMWSIAALFYAFEFVHRVLPSTMVPEWAEAFAAGNPVQLGSLAAMYFYAYALCQIPAGMLMDKFGIKIWLVLASSTLTLGCFMLSLTHSNFVAHLSRLLVGAGSAFAFVGCLKIAAEWLDTKFFPLAVGLTTLCGTIGAIFGGKPLAHLVNIYDWRDILLGLTLIGTTITLLLWLFIRKKTSHKENTTPELKFFSGLKQVMASPQTWLIALYGALVVIPVVAFGEMWADHFLHLVFDVSREDAAGARSIIFLGIALGGPTIGWLTAHFTYPRAIMATCSLCALICLCTLIYLPTLTLTHINVLFFVYGFFTSNMLLCFSLVTALHPIQFNGLAIGFTNMLIMISGGVFQHVIGKFLDLIRLYYKLSTSMLIAPNDFRLALTVLPICLIIAISLTSLIKNKHSTFHQVKKGAF